MTTQRTFDWTIQRNAWSPSQRPKPPYGPTIVEIVRACGLRRLFEISPGYERKMDFSGRIGTAFHKTIESLFRSRISSTENSVIVAEALRRFTHYLDIERKEAESRPRERNQRVDELRLQRAREAIASESLDISNRGLREHPAASPQAYETEIPVQTSDGIFQGYVDRAETSSEGTHIVDYKSALRVDVPERYERQLQMYAAMWSETRAEWPVRASLRYPLAGQSLDIRIDPPTCQSVMDDSRSVMADVTATSNLDSIANPGAVCRICEFRPWCRPFWTWQNREGSNSSAFANATLGFEGTVTEVSSSEAVRALSVTWRNRQVRVVTRPDRFSHMLAIRPGDVVRALDFDVQGLLTQPKAVATDRSEIFLVR